MKLVDSGGGGGFVSTRLRFGKWTSRACEYSGELSVGLLLGYYEGK